MKVASFLFAGEVNLAHFAEGCLRFSPQICLREPNFLFIEIGRCSKLYSEESFLARAHALLRRFNYEAKVAISTSVPRAMSQCQYAQAQTELLPLEALINFADPFGKIEDAILPKMIESLQHLGLSNIGDFLKLSPASLSSRFGPRALLCRYRLLEEIDCPWPQWVPEAKIVEVKEFQYEEFCACVCGLLSILDATLDKLFLRLWARGLSVAALKITLDFEKFSTARTSKRELIFEFLLPQKTKRSILPLIHERFEKEFTRRPMESPVQKITLDVLQTSKDYGGQRNFFHNREEAEEQFNSAIAQLVESVGKENVFRAQIIETSIPERSWQRTIKEQKELPDVAGKLPPRPTRLLRVPERIFITQDTLHIRRRPYRIMSWSVVEQISTAWLDDKVSRSYYRLELDGKPPVWIFKGAQDEYFLHGYFD